MKKHISNPWLITIGGGLVLVWFEEHSMNALRTVWSWASFEVTIPVWGILILIGMIFGLSKWSFRESISTNEPEEIPEVELSDFQMKMLEVFTDLDGGQISSERLTQFLNSRQLLVEQALDELQNQGLINYSLNYVSGTKYRLRPKGRDKVIELGLVITPNR